MKRHLFVVLGHVCLGLGVIGAFLPVMPTTVFLVGAAACYAKGSPALHRRLMEHRVFGPPLRRWEHHRAISLHGKILGITMVSVGIGASIVWGVSALWIRLLLAAIGGALIGFLLTVKTVRARV